MNALGQLQIPLHRQETDYSCGAASVRSVLLHFGHDVPESEIRPAVKTTEEHGTDPEDLADYLQTFPDLTVEVRTLNLRTLTECIDRGEPVIIDLQAWSESPYPNYATNLEEGHFVVLSGYDENKFYFADPADPNPIFLLKKDLPERWHDLDREGKYYSQIGVVVAAKAQSSRVASRYLLAQALETKRWGGFTFKIDRPKGFKKEWDQPDGSVKKYTYPVDYGYFVGHKGEDSEGLDAFVGSDAAGKIESFLKLKPEGPDSDKLVPDETKFLIGLSEKERKQVMALYEPEMVTELREYKDVYALIETLEEFRSAKKVAAIKLPPGWKQVPSANYIIFESKDGNVRVQDTKRTGHPLRFQVIFKPAKQMFLQDGKLVERVTAPKGQWLEVDERSNLTEALDLGVRTEKHMQSGKIARSRSESLDRLRERRGEDDEMTSAQRVATQHKRAFSKNIKDLAQILEPIAKDPEDTEDLAEEIAGLLNKSIFLTLKGVETRMVPYKAEGQDSESNGRDTGIWYEVTYPTKIWLQFRFKLNLEKRWREVAAAPRVHSQIKTGAQLPKLTGATLDIVQKIVQEAIEDVEWFQEDRTVSHELEDTILDWASLDGKIDIDVSTTDPDTGEEAFESASPDINWRIAVADQNLKFDPQGTSLTVAFHMAVSVKINRIDVPGDYEWQRRASAERVASRYLQVTASGDRSRDSDG